MSCSLEQRHSYSWCKSFRWAMENLWFLWSVLFSVADCDWRAQELLINFRLPVRGACNVCFITSVQPRRVAFSSLSLFTKDSGCCSHSAATAVLNHLSSAFFIECPVLLVTDRLCCFTANAWYHNSIHGLVALQRSSWSCYSNGWSEGLFFCVCEHIEEMMGEKMIHWPDSILYPWYHNTRLFKSL